MLESLEAKKRETGFSAPEAQEVLESLYVSQGNNWVGRGALAELTMEATLAAYEQFAAQEQADKNPGKADKDPGKAAAQREGQE